MEKALKCSIDKICYVGNFKGQPIDESSSNSELFLKFLYKLFLELPCKRLSIDNFYYKYSYMINEKIFFQFGNDKNSFRIEFNPNMLIDSEKESIKHILSYGFDFHLTRLDVAIDLYNYDLSSYNITTLKPIKKAYYYGKDGLLETAYFGSMKSNRFFRIYNKAKEQNLKNIDWWRFELQIRDMYITPFLNNYIDYFKDIFCYKYEIVKDKKMSFLEVCSINYLLMFPQELHQLEVRTKRKYKNLFDSLSIASLDYLNDIVNASKIDLLSSIFEYLPEQVEVNAAAVG